MPFAGPTGHGGNTARQTPRQQVLSPDSTYPADRATLTACPCVQADCRPGPPRHEVNTRRQTSRITASTAGAGHVPLGLACVADPAGATTVTTRRTNASISPERTQRRRGLVANVPAAACVGRQGANRRRPALRGPAVHWATSPLNLAACRRPRRAITPLGAPPRPVGEPRLSFPADAATRSSEGSSPRRRGSRSIGLHQFVPALSIGTAAANANARTRPPVPPDGGKQFPTPSRPHAIDPPRGGPRDPEGGGDTGSGLSRRWRRGITVRGLTRWRRAANLGSSRRRASHTKPPTATRRPRPREGTAPHELLPVSLFLAKLSRRVVSAPRLRSTRNPSGQRGL